MSKTPNVVKITIMGFSDRKLQRPSDIFVIPINPESIHRHFKFVNNENGGHTPGIAPEVIRLHFVFDNTGVVQGNVLDGVPISNQVEGLLRVVFDPKKKGNHPRFLKLVWGSLVFHCRISSLSINYTLFNEEGIPLRAKLDATFNEFIKPTKVRLRGINRLAQTNIKEEE